MSLLLLLTTQAAGAAALDANASATVTASASLTTQIALSSPTLSFSDNFNRADQALDASADWERADTDVGSLSIVGNAVVASSGVSIGNVYSGALPANQWAEFTFRGVAPTGTGKGAGVLLRATGGSASFSGYTVSLERNNAEAGTDLLQIRHCSNVATFSNVFGNGTLLAWRRVPDFAGNTSGNVVLRAEIVGSRITAYVDGSAWLSVSDAQIASGKAGLFSDSATVEDFSCGSFDNRAHTFAEGSLSTAIRLAASVAAGVTAAADLTTAANVALAASVSTAATASAALSTQIPLSASVSASASASGALSTAITLAASATATATTAADLTAGSSGSIAASTTATVSASGALTTQVRLAGAVSVSATHSAALTTQIRLAATASASVTTLADLTATGGEESTKPAGRPSTRKQALQRALDDAIRRASAKPARRAETPQKPSQEPTEAVPAAEPVRAASDEARIGVLVAQIERLEVLLAERRGPSPDAAAAIAAVAQIEQAQALRAAEEAEFEEVALIAAILEAA